ncbi:uncharacterized protein C7orf50 homolog isoform X2 [Coccinella septempunctata]|nr:uncharacterized protein C7orf50 homolog isoform X2 [Coccinella septempunctata]XP_044748246.1 uncharacterized protein C7orf50 homolog isoform X2 [Coccinella septempunctata]
MVHSEQKPVKKRNRGHNRRIGFTEEIVTRDVAENLLSQEPKGNESDPKTFRNKLEEDCAIGGAKIPPKKPKKRKQKVSKEEDLADIKVDEADGLQAKKKKRNEETPAVTNIEENEVEKSEKSLSKRALKRTKHQQLLDQKKKESDNESQQKALNYLSKWKHARSEWKFEKLRQVWLVQNIYDSGKIDEKYWETLIDYLNNSKGKVREKVINEAIKIIENEEIELNDQMKFKRAKDIVQCLQ